MTTHDVLKDFYMTGSKVLSLKSKSFEFNENCLSNFLIQADSSFRMTPVGSQSKRHTWRINVPLLSTLLTHVSEIINNERTCQNANRTRLTAGIGSHISC